VPPGVTAHRDIAYVPDGHERQKLDLYIPDTADKNAGKLPLIIWVHGGGWRGGSKEYCLPLARRFTARGYAVASIGYRLSSTAIFPAQIEDCKAAVRWLRANAGSYNIDADRFVAWGSSAGGHLVALLGTTGHIRTFDTGPNPDVSAAVQVVIDYYGPADFCDETITDPAFHGPDTVQAKLLGGPPLENPGKAAAASPVTYVGKTSAPMFILHGTDDPAVPLSQSKRLHAAMQKAGATSKLKIIPGAGHGGAAFNSQQTLDEVGAFIKEHLPAASQATTTQDTAIANKNTARPNAARPETPLRVVCYNIRAARGMDNRVDLARTAEVLRQLDGDIVLLQEVDAGTKRSGNVDQPAELGKMLGMHFYFAKAMNYGGGEYGNAILSKLPFAHTSTLPLIGGAEPRSAGIVEIVPSRDGTKAEAGGVRVMLVNVHLDARNTDVHLDHVKKISSEISRLLVERPVAAVIWAGDFNATATSPIWNVLKNEYGWTVPEIQGPAKASFPSQKPDKQIDWFLYRTNAANAGAPTLTVHEYKVVNEPMASDHCPLVFAVRLTGGK
jgi:acetyl esterase/lipase/endonuclease/exonuclease/phosphatase family metal-dependent hydrolase